MKEDRIAAELDWRWNDVFNRWSLVTPVGSLEVFEDGGWWAVVFDDYSHIEGEPFTTRERAQAAAISKALHLACRAVEALDKL